MPDYPTLTKAWWKEAVVYQIYPRSFKDSNGDGIGDLRGIIEKLDYIKDLGIDAVWLNPIYKSPNDDGGYDISDYHQIQEEFGTLSDFEELLQGLHDRGIRLIVDLVVNHSSDEHPWFMESRKSKTNKYRDYYFWRPAVHGGPPNNWPSFFGGSAWQLDDLTGDYYLHLFSRKQPDLNWENPVVRNEVGDVMKFWLDKGVDGLRLDVISAISKRTDFPATDTHDFNETIRKYYSNGPRLKEFIGEMRERVWDHYDMMTVGEGPGITPKNALEYLDEKKGLNMIFHFGHMFMDQGPGGRFDPVPYTLTDFKEIFKIWDDALKTKGWGSVFLGNHDFPRMVSRWGSMQHWEKSAKLLATLLFSMRGTPFLFQGDELGMVNLELKSIADSKDIETHNGWQEAKKRGVSEEQFLAIANRTGRDNARTPFQWDESKHAGFTKSEPWMVVNPKYTVINQQQQERDENSVLNYFRKMIGIRKDNLVLTYGHYLPIATDDEKLFIYKRKMATEEGESTLLVLLNFSDKEIRHLLKESLLEEKRLIGNYPVVEQLNFLKPWEACIYKI